VKATRLEPGTGPGGGIRSSGTLASLTIGSSYQMVEWLRRIDALRQALAAARAWSVEPRGRVQLT